MYYVIDRVNQSGTIKVYTNAEPNRFGSKYMKLTDHLGRQRWRVRADRVFTDPLEAISAANKMREAYLVRLQVKLERTRAKQIRIEDVPNA
jgi:hypothetical protein